MIDIVELLEVLRGHVRRLDIVGVYGYYPGFDVTSPSTEERTNELLELTRFELEVQVETVSITNCGPITCKLFSP